VGLEISGTIDKSTVSHLCQYFTEYSIVQELSFSNNRALSVSSHLNETLNFCSSFGTKNLKNVFLKLGTFPFAYVSFLQSGVQSLCEHLKVNNCLRVLDLSNTNIGKKEFAILCESLANNVTLTSLNLSRNGMKEDVLSLIGTALTKNTALLELQLDKNQFGSGPMKEFIGALLKNTTLQKLSLQSNGLTNSCLNDWVVFVMKTTTLKVIDLRNNDFEVSPKFLQRLRIMPCVTTFKLE